MPSVRLGHQGRCDTLRLERHHLERVEGLDDGLQGWVRDWVSGTRAGEWRWGTPPELSERKFLMAA